MKNLIETIIEETINKIKIMKNEGRSCLCDGCIFSEMQRLTDDELYNIIKDYDANFMD